MSFLQPIITSMAFSETLLRQSIQTGDTANFIMASKVILEIICFQ